MWIIAGVAGVIVGWTFPQPQWAKDLQDKVVAWVKSKV